jgi:probable rRNA maturation factor
MKDRDAALSVDVLVQSPRWKKRRGVQGAVRKAINAAADEISSPAGEVAVVLTDDAAIRKLNKQWRGIDKATNVLSFPSAKSGIMLGDIVIAYETLARESRDESKEFTHHLSHLAVHGFLHLMGYDHQNDSDAEAMEELEGAILARLRMPNPYPARG